MILQKFNGCQAHFPLLSIHDLILAKVVLNFVKQTLLKLDSDSPFLKKILK